MSFRPTAPLQKDSDYLRIFSYRSVRGLLYYTWEAGQGQDGWLGAGWMAGLEVGWLGSQAAERATGST